MPRGNEPQADSCQGHYKYQLWPNRCQLPSDEDDDDEYIWLCASSRNEEVATAQVKTNIACMEIVRRRKVVVVALAQAHRHHRLPRQHSTCSEKAASTPVTQLMKYGVPPLLALLTLKNQPKPEALAGENPAPFWCFIVATAAYWLIVGAMDQIKTIGRRWFKLLWRAAFASGILSATSVLSMFLPYPVSLLPLLLIWLPLALLLAFPKLYAALTKIQALAVRVRGFNSTNQPPHLPV